MFLQDVRRQGSFRVVLCYPNLYFVGMSNLGFQSVYRCSTPFPTWSASAPSSPTTSTRRTSSGRAARSSASRRARRSATSTRSPSRSPSRTTTCTSSRCCAWRGSRCGREERAGRDPLVILGGSALFLNPEPLAPFADLMAVGEGEALVAEDDGGAPRRRRPAAGPRAPLREGRLLRPVALRAPLPRGRHRGRLRRPRPRRAPARLAGEDGPAPVRDPHPPHRDVHEVHGGDLAGLPVHVPLLLGRVQLPARARLHAAADRGPRARGAEPDEQDRPRQHRGLRPPGDRGDRGRPRRPRLRGLGGLAPPRRPHARASSSSSRTPACRA